MNDPTHIRVRGARQHNLRGVDLDLPRNSLVVFTGVSGSGKSSLAHDTLYQEGQRRFLESLSSYARQFLGDLERPDVDHVTGLSPTIAVDQKTVNRNPRSTVGTITEIADHLRLLYARLGTPHCPVCDQPVGRASITAVVDALMESAQGRKLHVLGPLVRDRKGEYRKELDQLRRDGWVRVRVDGELRRLDEDIELARYEKHTIEVVVDRLKLDKGHTTRLTEAVEAAAAIGQGVVSALVDDEYLVYSTERGCADHPEVSIPELEPRLFSFNAPQGACPGCEGLGAVQRFEADRIVDLGKKLPDAWLALNSEGRLPFSGMEEADLRRVVKQLGGPWSKPLEAWRPDVLDRLLHGDAEVTWSTSRGRARQWRGLVGAVENIYFWTRYPGFEQFMSHGPCPQCGGVRLNPVARAVRFQGHSLPEMSVWKVGEAHAFFDALELDAEQVEVGRLLVKEVRERLRFLHDVGLGYLSLSRSARTLSGGEAQRIRLAAQVGSGLQGVTYVLDEPSIGLHPRDNQRLIETMKRLRDQGNSVLVVEHDRDTILAADHVVEVGPGAGSEGGKITAHGPPVRFLKTQSLTARYLRRELNVPIPSERRSGTGEVLRLVGARGHNLRDVTLELPLGTLTAVTGVSGSGKSSLLFGTLQRALSRLFTTSQDAPLPFDRIEGVQHLEKVIEISQQPIGRTPRSNPATYTGAFDLIRELFSRTEEARARGYKKGRFSFNVPGGRCEECQGAGVQVVEMQLLADVSIPCEICGGKRFNAETLEVTYKGLDIYQVLQLNIHDAAAFFKNVPKLRRILEVMDSIGLGYVQLGQPSTTLSGGEAQRVKLATELHRPPRGHTLYLLDEPTTGLHMHDVVRLVEALDRLVDAGHTVVVVEHDTDVVRAADHVIDLGPEGGDAGGRIVGQGTPEHIATLDTPTGRALAAEAQVLDTPAQAPRRARRSADSHGHDLVVEGARKHNLKRIDVRIPRNRMTVVTGPSGSGKTSLAFDTVFAEGQRRYVECMSTYARRFLGRLDRAPVDRVEGLAPAIAIDQKTAGRNPRSTVGTVTEIMDYLRLLYARIGELHCHHCERFLEALSPSVVAKRLKDGSDGAGWLLAPLRPASASEERRLELMRQGWTRLFVEGTEVRLEEEPEASRAGLEAGCELVFDRVNPTRTPRARLAEAIASAYQQGRGLVRFVPRKDGVAQVFTQHAICPEHGEVLPRELSPRHFSFNSRWGACRVCEGLGTVQEDGRDVTCPECDGARLQAPVRAVRLGGMPLHVLSALPVSEARVWVGEVSLDESQRLVAAEPLDEVGQRLQFLEQVGLGYLTLDRRASTLSGGEAQRIRLASQLGSGLTGCIYVLDEPTIGLHPRDTERLLTTLEDLRDLGNTLVVVEHDPDTIQRADHVLDLGPRAGQHGGELVAQGTPAELCADVHSVTGPWLAGTQRVPEHAPRAGRSTMTLRGATGNNLHGEDLVLPTGVWVGVSGVSGSGKSTLVMDTLAAALRGSIGLDADPLPHAGLELGEAIDSVVIVDQSPLGRSPRSTPATYLKLWDHIRKGFAQTRGAKERGWGPGRFSFNSKGGRCDTCEGAGAIQVEMHFLPDVWVTCTECGGRRFSRETLEVRWRGHTISEVLQMRADEALAWSGPQRALKKRLQALVDVGLGYITLGQPSTTLSGGEAQRVRLAAELSSRKGHCVYILDEPTTGLHITDVAKLVSLLHRLVDQGHTVLTIEHHLDMLRSADWLVDLGPEGGAGGGHIVANGPRDQVVAAGIGATAEALAVRR